jgi:lipopolysaccharide/colanic/teichoic acid biosynthesis glycosyltransferase
VRSTDQIGWLDNSTLGVLLPSTELEGAWIFAAKFQQDYFARQAPAPFTVYCYPDHWINDGNGLTAEAQYHGLDLKGDHGRFRMVSQKVERALVGALPAWKRILDIVGSLFLLLASSPIFLVVSIYIRMVSAGPVFFRQERVGYKGRLFTFLKFRTMGINNNPGYHKAHLRKLINSDKPMEKLDERSDPRIIFGGRVLRKACVDELPQLINVLKGEMSLVGPRPCLPYEAEEYLGWHKYRFDILPGITGLWQVSGKNKLTFKKMIRLDISYQRNLSLWLDLKILLLTVPAIFQFILDAVMRRIKGSTESALTVTEREPLAICQILEDFSERF